MVDQSGEQDQRIVVGVDGSEGSKKALRWAMGQARISGAAVEAVCAWQDPVMFGYPYGWPADGFDGGTISALTEKALDDTVEEVAAELGQPVKIAARVVQGHPAQVLLEAATGAQLLVVGGRGHSAFAGVLLGSVSQHCVQHSSCPVVVVHQ